MSLELVGKEQSYDPKCKLWHCVQNILETYHRHDGCSQLVFCDYATPQNKQYSIYSALGKNLEACGIPSKEIAFVHTCRTEEQKLKLYDAVNSGKIRVLIGSTFKLGIGANVQTKLKAIHHLDVPWRPADMVQREGRILRRGNEYKNIFIFRYIAEGSFDSYSWQILQTKQHFISQFLSGSGTVRSLQDFENDELNYAQVKALALSEPLMKEYTEKENELRRTRMVLQQEMEQKAEAKTQISVLEGQIKSLRQQLVQTEATALYVAEHIDLLCKEIVRAADWITSEDSGREPYFLGEFTLQILKDSTENISAVLSRGGVNYTLDLGHSFAGNKTRFKNFFLKFPAQADNLRKQIEDMEARKSDLKQQVKYVSQSSDRITLLEQELKAIFVKISQKAG